MLNPNKECFSFQDNVALMTYGDDNCMGVSENCPWFNHTDISRVLAANDIVYTMADKEAESIPYIHIDEVSFLKRTWRYDEDVDAYLCPLEEASIRKSLLVGLQKKEMTPEKQIISVIGSAIREYFWYGKQIFHEKSEFFKQVIDENELNIYLEDWVFPTWEELRDNFEQAGRVFQ